eukprot:1134693-Pyramimonas_sp.AAC.1
MPLKPAVERRSWPALWVVLLLSIYQTGAVGPRGRYPVSSTRPAKGGFADGPAAAARFHYPQVRLRSFKMGSLMHEIKQFDFFDHY